MGRVPRNAHRARSTARTIGQVDRDGDAVFRALAHPARRTIVAFLAALADQRRPVEAGEIAEEVFLRHHLTWPSTSKHLSVLRDAGVVTSWTRETYRFHRVERSALRPVRAWIAVVDDPQR